MALRSIHKINSNKIDSKNFAAILSAVFIFIAGIMIFQDFLEAKRVGRAFYFSESFLFKTIWLLFIPFLIILYKQLIKQDFTKSYSTALFIVVPVFIHFIILPIVFLFFTHLFYDGRYDLYKILSYTVANDLYILIIVYSTFVLGYKYFAVHGSGTISSEIKEQPDSLVVNNGKVNTVIKIQEIIQIVAATPYVTIQLENKKYLHTATLKTMCDLLDKKTFIRIHKSAIVNKKHVVSFKSRLNGDYDLLLNNKKEVRLSRTYAANFKMHLDMSSG